MKKIYIVAALAACLLSTTACSDFLDRDPDKILMRLLIVMVVQTIVLLLKMIVGVFMIIHWYEISISS